MTLSKTMQNKLIYMLFGYLLAAYSTYFMMNLTQNVCFAFLAFITVLAFWIGTLTVVFKVMFKR